MFSRLPARPQNRLAVIRVLLFSTLGTVLILALALSAIADMPRTVLLVPSEKLPLALDRWGLDARHLLLTMPLGAAVVLFSRAVIGFDTFGIFTPMLMALAFLQLGPVLGPAAMGGAIVLGMIIVPWLDRLDITRMGMMSVLIGCIALIQFLLQQALGGALLETAFPVVVSALVVERWWITREGEGSLEAAKLAGSTMGLALVIHFALAAPILRFVVQTVPLLVPLLAMLSSLLIARYRGLRLTELNRFTTVLMAENGPAGD